MKLDFGTAGIRGIVGESESNLNNIHAARVFDGFANYLLKNFQDARERGVVIGRDNRIKGRDFTHIAVTILNSYGIKVYFNDKMLATPFISFLTRKYNAVGAINITASHNPKQYNGIKIYNCQGCQLLPWEVNELKKCFKEYDHYRSYRDFQGNLNLNISLIELIKEKDYDEYVNQLLVINYANLSLDNLKIIYSPLHGTGYPFVKKIFDKFNAKLIYEPNEIVEDENFTYVENPNPETQIAFKNSIKLLEENQGDLILITDPDSDRVGVAINHKGKIKILSGNETAILITDYLLKYKPFDETQENYLVYSFVSTSLPAKMVQSRNIKSYITETGFKWIGNKINLLADKANFFFGFEESYGSLILDNIARDKDAIQGVLALAIIASLAKQEGLNLYEKIQSIYEKYGYVKTKSFSHDLKDQNQLEQIKSKFRTLNLSSNLIDFSKGYKDIEPNDMLMYVYDDDLTWVSLRPSGTEPKFKIYVHVIKNTSSQAEELFDQIVETINNKLF